ncbi:hypothetical protein ADUPG1_011258, partial [Aduncisulcus paluster]
MDKEGHRYEKYDQDTGIHSHKPKKPIPAKETHQSPPIESLRNMSVISDVSGCDSAYSGPDLSRKSSLMSEIDHSPKASQLPTIPKQYLISSQTLKPDSAKQILSASTIVEMDESIQNHQKVLPDRSKSTPSHNIKQLQIPRGKSRSRSRSLSRSHSPHIPRSKHLTPDSANSQKQGISSSPDKASARSSSVPRSTGYPTPSGRSARGLIVPTPPKCSRMPAPTHDKIGSKLGKPTNRSKSSERPSSSRSGTSSFKHMHQSSVPSDQGNYQSHSHGKRRKRRVRKDRTTEAKTEHGVASSSGKTSSSGKFTYKGISHHPPVPVSGPDSSAKRIVKPKPQKPQSLQDHPGQPSSFESSPKKPTQSTSISPVVISNQTISESADKAKHKHTGRTQVFTLPSSVQNAPSRSQMRLLRTTFTPTHSSSSSPSGSSSPPPSFHGNTAITTP